MEIKDRIRILVDENQTSVREICRVIQISPANMTYVLTGRNKPSADLIIKLSNYFNVTSDWILGLTDTRNTLDSTK